MCLATPARLIEINGDNARVNLSGIEFDVSVAFLDNPNIGDWVIVHAGVALSKVDQDHLDFWKSTGEQDELS
ncbi:MAG: HypC/HybG/HupF family hydrogenase formation chaperone [Deltaproteobacteria bacterium]|jgi:hydrogenase expression/formation protein HypC|nr:MAG: HypC/HybG/HupF family hydrogenase formation chaperone [Deltaproteobacteria bacterium]TNF32030.1 MAG: HypC/HybG/HupF family hydrogenase formation chaperone [Deltaproteobacteria bacterium]